VFKMQVQSDEKNPDAWHDVKGTDGALLTFESHAEARARMEALYPVLVKMENYAAGRKRTRVINIIEDEDDWKSGQK